MLELVCFSRSPQHKSSMDQGFASTILEPKLLVSCAGHLMTQCSIAFMIARAFPASLDLDSTERIIEEAREKAHTCPIFWFRGLPPSDWYPELPVADAFVEDFGSLDIMGGPVFTDGSGGAETKDPRFRRCGYGVTWILSDGGLLNTLGGRAGIFHGRNQSVARAELLEAVEALRLARRATQQVVIWADCMFVINGIARGRRRKHLSHCRPMGGILEGPRRHRPTCPAPQGVEKPRHRGRDCGRARVTGSVR